MNILNLIPTHNRLRNPSRIKFFDYEYKKPISLSRIDNQLYVHDGHHRLVYEISKGNNTLPDNYFTIKDFTKEKYDEINFDYGYVTPFDIESECRKPNFFEYKIYIIRLFKCVVDDVADGTNLVERFILSTKDMYVEKRSVFTMEELTNNYLRGVM